MIKKFNEYTKSLRESINVNVDTLNIKEFYEFLKSTYKCDRYHIEFDGNAILCPAIIFISSTMDLIYDSTKDGVYIKYCDYITAYKKEWDKFIEGLVDCNVEYALIDSSGKEQIIDLKINDPINSNFIHYDYDDKHLYPSPIDGLVGTEDRKSILFIKITPTDADITNSFVLNILDSLIVLGENMSPKSNNMSK